VERQARLQLNGTRSSRKKWPGDSADDVLTNMMLHIARDHRITSLIGSRPSVHNHNRTSFKGTSYNIYFSCNF
jgi:hypothetical protein